MTLMSRNYPNNTPLFYHTVFCYRLLQGYGGARGVSGGARGVSGGARGVMVIVVRNGHGDASSNHGQDWLHFT